MDPEVEEPELKDLASRESLYTDILKSFPNSFEELAFDPEISGNFLRSSRILIK